MGKVRSIIKGAADDAKNAAGSIGQIDFTSAFTKGMVATMLMRMAIKGIIKEVEDVIENIEKIPGVPQETIASVTYLRSAFHSFGIAAKQDIAELAAGLSRIVQTIGVFGANMVNQMQGLPEGDLPLEEKSPDDRARDQDPNFDKEVAASLKEQAKLKKELASITGNLAQKIDQLAAAEKGEQAYRHNKDNNELENIDSGNRSLQDKIQMTKDLTTLDKELQASENAVSKAQQEGAEKALLPWAHLQEAKQKVKDLDAEIAATPQYTVSPNGKSMVQNPDNVLKLVNLNKELAAAQKDLNVATKQYGDLWNELGSSIAQNIVSGIEAGKSFKNIIDQIITSVIKLIIEQEIEKPMASMFSSGIGAIGGAIIGAMATGGPYVANQPFIAGEDGPELINPGGQSGSVMNAGDTARMGGSGGTNLNTNVTNNFGGGMSRAEVASLIPGIVQQSRAAVMDAVRRGGAYRQTFLQGS